MSSSFSVNLNSSTDCYKVWRDYYYNGNSLKVPIEFINKIESKYSSDLNNWKLRAESTDENEYEIDDSAFDTAKANGKQNAKDATGYDGHKSYGSVVNGVVYAGAQIAGQTVGKNALEKGLDGIAEKTAENASKKAIQKAGNKALGENGEEIIKQAGDNARNKVLEGKGKSVGCIVGCVIGLAEGTAYTVNKPNKEQVEAANELRESILPDAQKNLAAAQDDMAEASENTEELREEAEEINEEASEQIEDRKTSFDFYRRSYKALQVKSEAAKTGGPKLTSSELDLMRSLAPQMQEISDEIAITQEDTNEAVVEKHDEMAEYQQNFDDSASTISEVQGATDYAANFDSTTEVMCYVEGGVQTLNAASSAKSSYQAFALANSGSWAFGATAWAYAFGVMGAAGAVMSGKGAYEQFKWASQVGKEIDVREETQAIGEETLDIYDDGIETFDINLDIVENDLNLEDPNDLEIPEDAATSSVTVNTPADNTDDKNNINKKKPEQEEDKQ